jgi:hypothetical protein
MYFDVVNVLKTFHMNSQFEKNLKIIVKKIFFMIIFLYVQNFMNKLPLNLVFCSPFFAIVPL